MTISEPIWPLKDDRTKVIIDDFVNDVGGKNANSVDVLTARLYGNGLRGQELTAVTKLAQMRKLERQPKRKEASNVLIMERLGGTSVIRFTNFYTADFACRLLRKQPNIIFAYVVQSPVVDLSAERFVGDMLRLL